MLFLGAVIAGQVTVRRAYAPLVARNPLHRHARAFWSVLYSSVAIQMAWVLRPFVGWEGLPPQFLRRSLWTNAYVVVLRDVVELFTR